MRNERLKQAIAYSRAVQQILRQPPRLSRDGLFESCPNPRRRKRLGKQSRALSNSRTKTITHSRTHRASDASELGALQTRVNVGIMPEIHPARPHNARKTPAEMSVIGLENLLRHGITHDNFVGIDIFVVMFGFPKMSWLMEKPRGAALIYNHYRADSSFEKHKLTDNRG